MKCSQNIGAFLTFRDSSERRTEITKESFIKIITVVKPCHINNFCADTADSRTYLWFCNFL